MFAGALIQSRVWLTPAAMATAAATASLASGFVEGETSVTRRRSSDGSLPILVYVYAPSRAPAAAPLMTSGSTRSRLTTTWSGEAGSSRARALTPLPTARRTCSGVTSTSPRPTTTRRTPAVGRTTVLPDFVFAPRSRATASGDVPQRLVRSFSREEGRSTRAGVPDTCERPTMTASASRGTDFDRDTETTNITFRVVTGRRAPPRHTIASAIGSGWPRTGLDHA